MKPFIALAAAALAAAASPAWAQQQRYSSGWGQPAATATVADPADARLQRLTDELGKLVDEAERARAADPRFLQDLRDLARRYQWAWTKRIASDDFADGDWTKNPTWSVWGPGMRAEAWNGVVFTAAAAQPAPATPPEQSQRSNDNDPTAAILGSLLQQLAKPDDRDRQQPAPAPSQAASEAGMKLPAAVPNAFAIRLALTAAKGSAGRFEFGVTQGKANTGYRLAYNGGDRPSLELIRLTSRGSAVIDASSNLTGLEAGKRHTIQLTRDKGGEMSVSTDGKELMRVRDRSFRDPFDGVLLLNKGGAVTVRSVEVYGAP